MKISVAHSSDSHLLSAIDEIESRLDKGAPDLILVYHTEEFNSHDLLSSFKLKFPESKIAGSTTCLGIMSNNTLLASGQNTIAVMAFHTSCEEQIGVGIGHGQSSLINSSNACEKAIQSAKRDGELPDFIWMMGSPGDEEEMLIGISKYFGTFLPVFGGSAADNNIKGHWRMFDSNEIINEGVVLITFFTPIELKPYSTFHSGYFPTKKKGIVTQANGRTVKSIDNLPAVEVYNSWTNNLLKEVKAGTNILDKSTLFPLGRIKSSVEKIPFYLLSHPSSFSEDGELTLFTEINIGDEVTLMNGTHLSLINRASLVVKSILKNNRFESVDITGALIVFCAGCMLHLNKQNQMEDVSKALSETLGTIPFLGMFTFGEQGSFREDHNLHGNLMISVTLFLKEKPGNENG